MYVVLTGDLKSSRKINDRAGLQEKLKSALKYVNKTFDDFIVAEFVIVGGDSFQGMISSPDLILSIYYALFENIGHPFYLGIGIGSISTNLSENIAEIDGEAFHLSAEALEGAKREKKWIKLKSGLEDNDIFECLLNFMFEVMWSWTDRQKEIIIYYRKHGENRDAVKYASSKFGIVNRSVYKTLKRGKYPLLASAEAVLKKSLNQKWFKLKSEPKMVQIEK